MTNGGLSPSPPSRLRGEDAHPQANGAPGQDQAHFCAPLRIPGHNLQGGHRTKTPRRSETRMPVAVRLTNVRFEACDTPSHLGQHHPTPRIALTNPPVGSAHSPHTCAAASHSTLSPDMTNAPPRAASIMMSGLTTVRPIVANRGRELRPRPRARHRTHEDNTREANTPEDA